MHHRWLRAGARYAMTANMVLTTSAVACGTGSGNETDAGASTDTAAASTDTRSDGESAADACSALAPWKTPIGSPTWEPFGAQLFTTTGGTAASGYAELMSAYDAIFGAEHQFDKKLAAWGPGAPHEGPYETEIDRAFAARSLVDRDSFTVDEFTAPRVVTLPVFIVPRCGSATGRSVDFESGPIIPHALFPITITAPLFRAGSLWDPDRTALYPAHDAFIGAAAGDGASHVTLYFGDSTEFGPPGSGAAGEYEFRIRLLDQSGAGWNIVRRFTVK